MTNGTTTPWLSESEQCLWRSWLSVARRMDSALARDLQRDTGLSMADYEVLVNLSEAEDHRMRMAVLADRLTWDRSRLSHQITRMMNRGLLGKETCNSDGRGAFVVLTDHGLATIRDAAPSHVASVRRMMFDVLSEQQADDLRGILGTLAEQFGD
ncbi:MarR family winged helix-turn-helix transcriptional regulator [Corynebacterium sp.]|uniref:MarR family winged helix-turn-helix transcriptional regulator n=1 Tax=Corynebacterium sp. TaxID=1720 RepID=UPI0025C268FD|nr:MarR family winged helix-turn-helix transcriptional regulator [Corynebacterium sp.]